MTAVDAGLFPPSAVTALSTAEVEALDFCTEVVCIPAAVNIERDSNGQS